MGDEVFLEIVFLISLCGVFFFSYQTYGNFKRLMYEKRRRVKIILYYVGLRETLEIRFGDTF